MRLGGCCELDKSDVVISCDLDIDMLLFGEY